MIRIKNLLKCELKCLLRSRQSGIKNRFIFYKNPFEVSISEIAENISECHNTWNLMNTSLQFQSIYQIYTKFLHISQ